MSVDLNLYNKMRQPVAKSEVLEKLSPSFDVLDITTDGDSDKVLGFTVKAKRDPSDKLEGGFEFSYQKDDGTYWTYTYNYDNKDAWNAFVNVVTDVCKAFNFLIDDPQSGNTSISPETFLQEQTLR